MALSPGKLRQAITIQERIKAQDAFGAPLNVWQDVWKGVPAAVEPLSAREFIASAQYQSQVSARITIRYRDGLNAGMRILFRGKIYNIVGILPDNVCGLDYITLPVTEGTNEG